LNAIRANSSLRIVAVMATILGWFVLSNHCALGLMTGSRAAADEHKCCHNRAGAPEKPVPPDQSGPACCKGLNAVVPGAIQVGAQEPVLTHLVFEAAWVWTTHTAEKADVLSYAGDTGPPPHAASFNELVLHRSLRSHAPPFLA
jgi:hypothetical protein